MKHLFVLYFLCVISIISYAQQNKALYSIDNTHTLCIDNQKDIIYGITWGEQSAQLVSYNLLNGEIIKTHRTILPENPVVGIIQNSSKNQLHLITSKKIDQTNKAYFDAIYTINLKTDKIKLAYEIKYNYPVPSKIQLVDNRLIFTTPQQPTRIYDLQKQHFEVLCQNTDFQLLNVAPEQKGFIMLNTRKVMGDSIPIYFMDKNLSMSECMGYYKPNVKIESNTRSYQIPTISLNKPENKWLIHPIRYNCFPLESFQITMRPFWLKQALYLEHIETISSLLASNGKFLIAKSANTVYVYNIINADESAHITKTEIQLLENYFNERNSYDRVIINSAILMEVFNAVFYDIYYQNKKQYIAILKDGSYTKLSNIEDPISLINPNFKIHTDADAIKFQLALNELFPFDPFNRKDLRFYKENNEWYFIRGQAYNKNFGYIVTTDNKGMITAIAYSANM